MLTLSGEFDLATTSALARAIARTSGALQLDASAVEFIDSSGMHAIADAVGARGATFVNPSAAILRFLELMDQSGLRSEIACS
jgi:anti-anti-sigma regulatory factor